MIDYAARVEDDRVADLAMGANERAGGYDDITPQRRILCDVRRRVNRVGRLDAAVFQMPRELATDSVMTDGDNAQFYSEFLAQAREIIRRADDGNAVDVSAMRFGVGIDESDGFARAAVLQDVQNDPAMPAASEDDAAGAILRSFRKHIKSYRRIGTGTLADVGMRG